MKKIKFGFLLLASLLVTVVFVSCDKNEEVVPGDQLYDVSFNAASVTESGPSSVKSSSGMQKASAADNINCSSLQADYAMYKIDGGAFKTVDVFYVNGQPWTSSIKLSAGTHTLNEFILYSDNNTPNNTSDDIVLSATPHTGSAYAAYLSSSSLALDRTITVVVDKKNEIKLETVCFETKNYDKFGFSYFKLTQINVKQLIFFADFCMYEKADYEGSLYATQTNWGTGTGFIDVPAIMKIEVWHNGVLQNTFSNTAQGEKLFVNYVDNVGVTDAYELKLFILVRQGSSFNYVYFKSWKFNDTSNISEGTDGVIDGVLGNCYDKNTPPDFILAPWMNLPLTATYTITATNSTLGGYVDATLSNIPSGYDIKNGVYASFCGDHNISINANQAYVMNVYSSLYPDKLPTTVNSSKWEKINWLINHLDYYPGYKWYDIQAAIWLYDSPVWNGSASGTVPALTAIGTKMKADADLYGPGYRVPPGGWACVLFVNGTTVQPMVVRVDP